MNTQFSSLNFGLAVPSSSNAIEWNMGHIVNKDGSSALLKKFEDAFCLYSKATEMLYPVYNVMGLNETRNKIKLMPVLGADSDPYQPIPVDALVDSDFKIIPGELMGKTGLYISINKYKALPLVEGLKTILREECCGRTCLPVIMESSLRELGKEFSYPYLQLSCLKLDEINHLSVFERADIAHIVTEKLKRFVAENA